VPYEIVMARWTNNDFADRHHFMVMGTDGVGLMSADGYWQPTFELQSNASGTDLQSVITNISASSIKFAASGMNATNVQSAILEAAAKGVRIMMPDEIVAVVGDKLQLFYRGIIEANNPYVDPCEIICAKGSTYPRYWEFTPTLNDLGSYTITINLLDNTGATKQTASSSMRVVCPSRSPTNKVTVLCVGDSLTSGLWPQEFYRRLTQAGGSPVGNGFTNIQFIGMHAMPNYSDQYYTGYGGWSWNTYENTNNSAAWVTCIHDKDITDQKAKYSDANGGYWNIETIESSRIKMIPYGGAIQTMPGAPGTLVWVSGGTHTTVVSYSSVSPDAQSPFVVEGKLSFGSWATNAGITNISICYVLLGWNNILSGLGNLAYASNHNVVVSQAQTFISQLHADYPSAQVRLMGLQVPSINGGLGANYGATGGSASYYKLLRSVNGLNLAYQDLANNPTNSSFTKFINICCQFDSENNMPSSAYGVDSRNSTTELRGTNGVHPDTGGYDQIADVAYRDFIRTYCQ
jgi:lysophospholipase L1-like esterase